MSIADLHNHMMMAGLSTGSVLERLHFKTFRAIKGRLKRRYARALFEQLDGVVIDGPFRGMRLSGKSAWSNDIASMLLGEYEFELQDLLDHNSLASYDVFIDIGSADGYFAIGVALKSSLPVFAYEVSPKSREICRVNGEINSVSHRLFIRGEADEKEICSLLGQYDRPLVLIDIEGNELALFSPEVCRALAHATIIVENHKVSDLESVDEISRRMAQSHAPQHIGKAPRNPFRHPFVKDLAEDFAHLMLSEERAGGARWVALRPIV